MSDNRPTKKQRELLNYLEGFIKENGYGPSYREVMRALEYKSVSTVATHVDGLIARGFLRKKDHSARSLEVVTDGSMTTAEENPHITWLKREIATRRKIETPEKQAEADTLESALKLLDSTPN